MGVIDDLKIKYKKNICNMFGLNYLSNPTDDLIIQLIQLYLHKINFIEYEDYNNTIFSNFLLDTGWSGDKF